MSPPEVTVRPAPAHDGARKVRTGARRIRTGARLVPGNRLAPRALVGVDGTAAPVPDPEGLVHLQLRRFAGCPVCNLHLASVARRHAEITAAGVREVVVFHSSADDLVHHGAGSLPFPVVADPGKDLYRALGAETSVRAMLDPRAWPTIGRALVATTRAVLRGRARTPSLWPRGGRWGLPADLLIAPDGTVVAAHYGEHADDQWTVDELLAQADRHR